MNGILNYATLTWKFLEPMERTNIRYGRKSQTVSGQSRELPFAAWRALGKVPTASAQSKAIRESLTPHFRRFQSAASRALRKVGTLFPLFKALPLAEILSTASIELLDSKIQTPSGEFRRSRLRNLEFMSARVAVAPVESFDILRSAHPPSLWLYQAQMWRVFLAPVQWPGGAW
jgi:hypothetical protein